MSPETRLSEHKITSPGPLLDAAGRLREAGWARQPRLDANLERAGGALRRALRVKRWDYYGIWAPGLYASAAVAHVGYLGMAFAYVLDLETGANPERSVVRPLGAGVALPRNSDRGDVRFEGGGMRLELALAPGVRHVRVADPRFDGGAGLEIEAALACPPEHESVVTATPFPGGGFYYNRKLQLLPATGHVRWGARRVELVAERDLGQLDWGRGIWPYRTHWVWASASGRAGDGRRVGLNLGFFGDPRAAAENALVVDGRVHKLGAVEARFDPRDYRKPWRFADRAGRLDVELVPRVERVARTRALVLRTEVHQCFGLWSGRVRTDAGEALRIEDLPGFAEEHRARW